MAIRNTTKAAETDPLGMLLETIGPGAIERQEARGQSELVASSTLPVPTAEQRRVLEGYGVVFAGPAEGDPMFLSVTLPEGWRKQATDHAMWSHLLDAQGRKRASIFYKAAFYDRRADMHLERRYTIERDYERKTEYVYRAKDGDTIIHETTPVPVPTVGGWQERDAAEDAARGMATVWLDAHAPGWQAFDAHWS